MTPTQRLKEIRTARVRSALKAAKPTINVPGVAKELDMAPTTIYRFIDGESVRESTVKKLKAWAVRRGFMC